MNIRINFASTRLAFFLIAVLLILIAISAIIPQKDIAADQITNVKSLLGDNYKYIEKLKLDQVYTAPYFFIVLGLLAVNIIIGNIRRFRIAYKTDRTLIKARHLGSLLFHFSLIVIMVGAILNFLYKFEGVFSLTEGQYANDTEADYLRLNKGPLYSGLYNNFSISLDSLYPAYEIHNDFTEAAKIKLSFDKEDFITTEIIHNSKPFIWNNKEFHCGSNSGYSPKIVLTDSLKNTVFESFVRIAHHKEKDIDRHFDFILLEPLDLRIDIEVLPDSIVAESSSFNIKVANETEVLYDDEVRFNQTACFDQYCLTVPALRRWCYIVVVESPFLAIIFWGFWLALVGLAIGFVPRFIGELNRKK